MRKYYQKQHIKSLSVTDTGLSEITFKDNSRYIGQMRDDVVEGRGTFYVQSVAKIEGKFFANQIIDGTFYFDGSFVWEGSFDDNEGFLKGTLELVKTRDRLVLDCVGSRVISMAVGDKGKPVYFDVANATAYDTVLPSGIKLELSADGQQITFKQTYNENLLQGDHFSIHLKTGVYKHNFYEFNQLKGVQKELHLSATPFVKSYEINPFDLKKQSFRMISAAGYNFESSLGYDDGILKEVNKDYVYHGAVDGGKKTGPGVFSFNEDSCEIPVTCLEDKIVFDNLESVFTMVKNFDCSKHTEFRFSESIAKVRFIENMVAFEGKLEGGNSVGPIVMKLAVGLTYKGKLADYKMEGRGSLSNEKFEISGEFVRNELRFGNIDYKTGARYEGQLLAYQRSGSGKMTLTNRYIFQGQFLNDRATRKGYGTVESPGGRKMSHLAVDLDEFGLCIFVPQKEADGLLVWSYSDDKMYDAKFLDKLESSGVNIRESLRNIKVE